MASTISPQALAQLHRSGQGIDLIDVRTPAEFQQVHVEFARNIPLSDLDIPATTRINDERGVDFRVPGANEGQ